MNHYREGLISVHVAVLIFGLTALFSKLITLSALDITFLRCIFAAAALIVFIKLSKQTILLAHKKDYLIVAILSFFVATHWVTFFHSMQVSSVAVGIISLYTYPVITVFLEPLFHGQRPQFKDIVSALMVLVGVFLLVPDLSLDNDIAQGVLWGVLSAFLFSMRNIIQGRYFKRYSAKHALFYQVLFAVFILSPFAVQSVGEVSQQQWLLLVLLGVFFTAVPHTLFAHSLLYLKAKSVSLIACMQVVYGTVFAALFLAEMPSWSTLIGGLIVVSAAGYETLSTNNDAKKTA